MANEPASPGRPPVSEQIRVLLVDDDESTAILVRSLLGKLKQARYVLEWRGTAAAGLAALVGERWDACLLDYHIGDDSGFDVLKAALQRNVTTPIIMFTSGAGTDVDLVTVRAGAASDVVWSCARRGASFRWNEAMPPSTAGSSFACARPRSSSGVFRHPRCSR